MLLSENDNGGIILILFLLSIFSCVHEDLSKDAEKSLTNTWLQSYDDLPRMFSPTCARLDIDGTLVIKDLVSEYTANWRAVGPSEISISYTVIPVGTVSFDRINEDEWSATYDGFGEYGTAMIITGCDLN